MRKLTDLPGIGPDTARLLNKVGIHTPEELESEGAKQAWLKIYGIDSSACVQRLYGLQAAISGVNVKQLDENVKNDLKEFCRKAKSGKNSGGKYED
jgi:DNA transformation protein